MSIDHDSILESIDRLKKKGTPFRDGLTDSEIQRIEHRFQFTFPPEYRFFLQTALPVRDYYTPWGTWV